MKTFKVGEKVQMKKKHPCGSSEWEILRTGTDIKAKCLGCGHIIMLPRYKFVKKIKQTNSN